MVLRSLVYVPSVFCPHKWKERVCTVHARSGGWFCNALHCRGRGLSCYCQRSIRHITYVGSIKYKHPALFRLNNIYNFSSYFSYEKEKRTETGREGLCLM
jgi:hypothetical protein